MHPPLKAAAKAVSSARMVRTVNARARRNRLPFTAFRITGRRVLAGNGDFDN